jgi:uncharacterized surface protein with fasciclin (FAS1) repeats
MFNFRSNLRTLLVPAAVLALAACGDDEPMGPIDDGPDSIVEIAQNTSDLSTLVAALESAGLVPTVEEAGPFTVFAPVNSAFTALGSDVVGALLQTGNRALLTRILTFHVVSGAVLSSDLSDGQTVTTLEGNTLTVGIDGGNVTLNGVAVVDADIEASNGVIHLVGEVLVPPVDVVEKAVLTSQTQTLAAAVGASGLAATLQGDGPFTVFAPINEAFAALGTDKIDVLLAPENQALLQKILTYHVIADDVRAADLVDGGTATTVEGTDLTFDLSGATPMVNGANIIATDIETENGVIHLIDGVLAGHLDVPDVAVLNGFGTLAAALGAADLVDALRAEGPFTVFAPTNDAFAALGEDVIARLLDEGNVGFLTEVLGYHVVAGVAAYSGDLADGQMVTTLQGEDLTIGVTGEGVTVNGVAVALADVPALNGVIHVVGEVLVPSVDIVEKAILTSETQTLVDAVIAGDLVGALQGEGPFTVFAPINEAFAALGTDKIEVLLAEENQALLQKILTYHVIADDVRAADLVDGGTATTLEGTELTFDLSGDLPMVNGANIIATDIETENGVIHLIDGVLTENADIVDVATLNGFETLVALVEQQELTDVLRGDNEGAGYTVFAPTEDAFAALSSVPSGEALTAVLLYHVVGATVGSGDLSDGQVVTTAEGSAFTVNIDGAAVSITDGSGATVNVVLTDVAAANGVIHVVDAVLLPGS